MAHEIERKFLLESDEWKTLPVKTVYNIAQGYIEGENLDISFVFNRDNNAVFTFRDMQNANDALTLTVVYNKTSGFADFIGLSQIDLETGRLSIRDGLVCRLRMRHNMNTGEEEAFLTIKSPTDNPDVSDEFEETVDLKSAAAILDKFGSYVVEKMRHVVMHEAAAWEVDIFQKKLDGLEMAEIEVENAADFEKLAPLPGLGADVTNDNRYKNRALGEFGIPKP